MMVVIVVGRRIFFVKMNVEEGSVIWEMAVKALEVVDPMSAVRSFEENVPRGNEAATGAGGVG